MLRLEDLYKKNTEGKYFGKKSINLGISFGFISINIQHLKDLVGNFRNCLVSFNSLILPLHANSSTFSFRGILELSGSEIIKSFSTSEI